MIPAAIIVFSFAGLLTYFARRIDKKNDAIRELKEKISNNGSLKSLSKKQID